MTKVIGVRFRTAGKVYFFDPLQLEIKTVYMDAGCWNFDGATQLPSKFSLARKPMKAVSKRLQFNAVVC